MCNANEIYYAATEADKVLPLSALGVALGAPDILQNRHAIVGIGSGAMSKPIDFLHLLEQGTTHYQSHHSLDAFRARLAEPPGVVYLRDGHGIGC